MSKLIKLKRIRNAAILTVTGILLLCLMSCNNSTTPENDYVEANVIVTNECGLAVDVHLDGTYLGDIGDTETQSITQVPFGVYTLEAVDSNNTIVASTIIEVNEVKEYFWTISP